MQSNPFPLLTKVSLIIHNCIQSPKSGNTTFRIAKTKPLMLFFFFYSGGVVVFLSFLKKAPSLTHETYAEYMAPTAFVPTRVKGVAIARASSRLTRPTRIYQGYVFCWVPSVALWADESHLLKSRARLDHHRLLEEHRGQEDPEDVEEEGADQQQHRHLVAEIGRLREGTLCGWVSF